MVDLQVVLGRGYVENVSLSNLKMVIGVITCAIALAAQFYPKKFPENKPFLIGCIILYVVFNVLLQYIILTKEKQHILFTHPVRLLISFFHRLMVGFHERLVLPMHI